jgi:hypothetical protein
VRQDLASVLDLISVVMSETAENLIVQNCRVEAVAETHISDLAFDIQHQKLLERYETRSQMVLQSENVDEGKKKGLVNTARCIRSDISV